jgi:hypothetical protein
MITDLNEKSEFRFIDMRAFVSQRVEAMRASTPPPPVRMPIATTQPNPPINRLVS